MALYARNGKEVDVAIGGVPFRLATSQDFPQSLETIPVRKDQFDTENDPGEQSLSGWWRRSQESFHEGAGNKFAEARTELESLEGFYDSSGVNVFERGQVTLLRRMVRNTTLGVGHSRIGTYRESTGRRNLTMDPSAESNDWWDPVSSATLTWGSTTVVHSGTYSLKVDFTAHNSGVGPAAHDLVAGRKYTTSAYVYIPTQATTPYIQLKLGASTSSLTSTKNVWTRLSVTWEAANTYDTPDVLAVSPGSTSGTFYVDSVLTEEADRAYPYFDGNDADADWLGTANDSVSVQVLSGDRFVSALHTDSIKASSAPDGAFTTLMSGTHGVNDVSISSGRYFAVDGESHLHHGHFDDTTVDERTNLGGDTPARIAFGKHRLWICGGRSLWQPAIPVDFVSVDPTYRHPNPEWQYTCMAEGPSAMYFGGHDGDNASIQAVALDSAGGVPTLTGATVTAILPAGELVTEIGVLAGQYLGIGTSKGFRMGTIDGDTITYGPLLMDPGPCTALTTLGTSFIVAFNEGGAEATTYRVDTAHQLSEGVFAYSKWVTCGTGHIVSLAVFEDDRILALDDSGYLWVEHATELVSSGWVQTGQIRFRMTEPKLYKYLDLDTEPLDGTVVVSSILDDGTENASWATFSTQGQAGVNGLTIPDLGPQRHLGFKFTLTRKSTDATLGPVLRSYLVKALPSVKPQRLITLPLMCYDREAGRSGKAYGKDGYAEERIAALQALEDVGNTINFDDFTMLTPASRSVIVEGIRFIQFGTGGTPPGCSGQGGILLLTLRTVDA